MQVLNVARAYTHNDYTRRLWPLRRPAGKATFTVNGNIMRQLFYSSLIQQQAPLCLSVTDTLRRGICWLALRRVHSLIAHGKYTRLHNTRVRFRVCIYTHTHTVYRTHQMPYRTVHQMRCTLSQLVCPDRCIIEYAKYLINPLKTKGGIPDGTSA